jgi:hypothetical protein
MDDDNESDIIPWPKSGQTLLGPDERWSMNACVDWGRGNMNVMIDGYEAAAKHLFRAVDRREVLGPDAMFFPIAFLWRHVVELRLKQVIYLGLWMHDQKPKMRTHHKLKDLWNEAKPYLVEVDDNGAQADGFRGAAEMIIELDAVDPEGAGFRYPVATDGKTKLLDKVPNLVNLVQFNTRMIEVATLVSCGVMSISARLDYMNERQREERDP